MTKLDVLLVLVSAIHLGIMFYMFWGVYNVL
jgi:hypothetical protein